MKFIYSYRDSSNVFREGVFIARDRDSAFRELRKIGVRPVQVVPAPGVVNFLFGSCKRWTAIVVLCVFVLVLAVLVGRMNHKMSSLTQPLPRHQIYGDPALFEEYAREDFKSLFDNAGDRYLARFAQPGSKVGSRAALVEDESDVVQALSSCIGRDIEISDTDRREARELKQIVAGMKAELVEYLSDGVGTISSYIVRLKERQREEDALLRRAAIILKDEKDLDVWRSVNDELRKVGLRTIPPPEDFYELEK